MDQSTLTRFQAHWENDEGVCPGCKAEWVNNVRNHTDECKYLAWLDETVLPNL